MWVQPDPAGAWCLWHYSYYKCKNQNLALVQLKHIDAPDCPKICANRT